MTDAQNTHTECARSSCPVCASDVAGRSFCPQDGALPAGPFSLGDRYWVEEVLGQGGMALVFGARHLVLGKQVAVKVLRPGLAAHDIEVQRFLREAQVASQLRHENIVDVIDFGRDEALDVSYLVMERLPGRTLADRLREGPLHWRAAIPILVQLARALSAAHAAGVVHRDVNPRNVFLLDTSSRTDVVKLCDFGLCRKTSGDDRVTAAGIALGTPAYMAPEQLRGDTDIDNRADVYAFGATAYELLSGELHHPVSSNLALILARLNENPAPLGERRPELGVPPLLDDLVLRCLALDPAHRPADMVSVESALVAIAQNPAAPTSASGAPIVGQMAASYRIMRRLASGGASSVYLAEHAVLDIRAAVKVLRPELAAVPAMVERFVKEAQTASQLGGAHVPRYFDFGYLAGGQPFAVMELLGGESLADRIRRGGPMPLREAAEILDQVARTIARAHEAGIVHRDIKPDNLFLVRDGDKLTVKVLDFGIAAFMDADVRMTAPGLMMGTPAFCAPEQATGGIIGPAADIYALGVTAFEMLTGRCPFAGETHEVLLAKSTREAPSIRAYVPALPEVVAEAVAHMLARDPAARPASMTDVCRAIASWPSEPVDRPISQPPGPVAGLSVWVRLAAVAAVVLLAAGAWWWTGRPARPAAAGDRAPGASRDKAPARPVAEAARPVAEAAHPPAPAPARAADPAGEPAPKSTPSEQAGTSQPLPAPKSTPSEQAGTSQPLRSSGQGAPTVDVDVRDPRAGEPADSPPVARKTSPRSKSRSKGRSKSRRASKSKDGVLIADPFEE